MDQCILFTLPEVRIFEADIGKNDKIFSQKCQENVRIVSIFRIKFFVDTLFDVFTCKLAFFTQANSNCWLEKYINMIFKPNLKFDWLSRTISVTQNTGNTDIMLANIQ